MRTAGALAATGILLFLAAIAACSSDEPAASAPTPDGGGIDSGGATDAADGGTTQPGAAVRGTRLAPQFLATADGLSDFYTMVDTGLGDAPCAPGRAGDGATRCLPQGQTAYASGVWFSDSSCQSALAASSKGCAKPRFALKSDPEAMGCNVVNDVHDLGAEHTGQIYQRQGPGTCAPVTASPQQAYWLLGTKRGATEFVKLTQKTDSIAGGVGVSMMEGEDGSRAPQYGLVDVARGRVCSEGKTTDQKTRCVPSAGGYTGNRFTDGTCLKEAAQVQPYDCDPLFVADTASGNTVANDGTVQIFSLGAKMSTKDTWMKNDLTCDGPMSGSEDVYERGAELAPATFPELVATTKGGTRIVAARMTASGVTLPPTYGYRDLTTSAKCSFMTASDGKQRCLPHGDVRVFSDDQCTVSVISTTDSPPPAHALGLGTGCPRPFLVLPVGAAVTPKPAKLYDNVSGPCVESAIVSDSQTVYALGAETPPSTFVEATLVKR